MIKNNSEIEENPKKVPSKKVYICKCKYRFSVEEGKLAKVVCPWCGRDI